MDVWAIADLHLAFGVPEKTMEVFGNQWIRYAEKIEANWRKVVQPSDLVLVAGDISWALNIEDAGIDLAWIDQLPGTKVLIKGNHDYWWSSLGKVKKILPASIQIIQNNSIQFQDVSIGGTRLWDTDEYNFDAFAGGSSVKEKQADSQKIFNRELERLELSLKELNKNVSCRIAMTHYPPVSADLQPSKTTALLEKYNVQICVFGHLHNMRKETLPFGKKGNISYYLTSCDYLDFSPLKIYSSAK